MIRGALLLSLLLAAPAVTTTFPFRDADANSSPRIARLRREVVAGARNAVSTFWTELQTATTPIVEPSPSGPSHSLVTFVWRGTSTTRNAVIVDGVASGVGGIDPAKSQMQRVPGTDVWFRTYDVRNDARFTYKLSENDSMVPFTSPARRSMAVRDPLNPRVSLGFSYVELADAPAFVSEAAAAPLKGSVEMATVVSATTGNEHTAWVYVPPGFRASTGYPLIVVMDGREFTTVIPGPAILDTLIARGRLRPLVAVFVDTSFARSAQLSCSRPFSDLLATELVPWMRATYGAGANARETAVGGSSLGGLAAACAAIAHPDVFGNVLSQSGSYWWTSDTETEWLTRQVRLAPALPLRVFLEVGAMEIPDQLETNRRFRDALRANGATLDYREFNGNHHYLPWRAGFADGLVALFGTPQG